MPEPSRNPHRRPVAPVLWAVLTAAVLLNVLSAAGVLPLAAGIACGIVTLGCAAALVVVRVRRS